MNRFLIGFVFMILTARFFTETLSLAPKAFDLLDLAIIPVLLFVSLVRPVSGDVDLNLHRRVLTYTTIFFLLCILSCLVNFERVSFGPVLLYIFGMLEGPIFFIALNKLIRDKHKFGVQVARFINLILIVEMCVVAFVSYPMVIASGNPDKMSGTFGNNSYQFTALLIIMGGYFIGRQYARPKSIYLALGIPTGGNFFSVITIAMARADNPTLPVMGEVVSPPSSSALLLKDDGGQTRRFSLPAGLATDRVKVGDRVIFASKFDRADSSFHVERLVAVNPMLALPLIPGLEERARNLYFHVPSAWLSQLAWFVALFYAVLYLRKGRPEDDVRATAAAGVGALFCVLATVTGAVWAKFNWGEFWNWDPRQVSIFVVLVVYGAYFALRSALSNEDQRARLRAEHVGFVFQSFQLLDNLNALENVMLPLELEGHREARSRADRASRSSAFGCWAIALATRPKSRCLIAATNCSKATAPCKLRRRRSKAAVTSGSNGPSAATKRRWLSIIASRSPIAMRYENERSCRR